MIIGISGKKNAGKDEVADYISEKMFLNKRILFDKVKFADKLKDIVCLLINCTPGDLEDRLFKETKLGEEWVKYQLRYISYSRLSYGNCPDYYEKYFCSKEEAIDYIEGDLEVEQDSIEISKIELTPRLLLQLLGTECGRKIIHPNIWVNSTMSNLTDNSNWVISDVRFPNEAKAIKDKGGILIRVNRPIHTEVGSHLSETALDDYKEWDFVVNNDRGLSELYYKVDKIISSLTDFQINK